MPSISELSQQVVYYEGLRDDFNSKLNQAREELYAAQAEAIGWPPRGGYARYAGEVLDFANSNELDPVWLGEKVLQAISDARVAFRPKVGLPPVDAAPEKMYESGIWHLSCIYNGKGRDQEGHLYSAAEAFRRASGRAEATDTPTERNSLFYRFIAGFAPKLAEIKITSRRRG